MNKRQKKKKLINSILSGSAVLYHIHEVDDYPKITKLTPFIPESSLQDSPEDKTMKRVCVSNTIGNCLLSIGIPNTLYDVYVVDEKLKRKDIRVPSINTVFDCEETGELWVLKEVKVKRIGTIKTSESITSKKRINNKVFDFFIRTCGYTWNEKLEEIK